MIRSHLSGLGSIPGRISDFHPDLRTGMDSLSLVTYDSGELGFNTP